MTDRDGGGRPAPVFAVIGGGISGLATAWALTHAGRRVVLLEGSPRLGGRIETVELAGRAVDTGPDSFITANPAAVSLAHSVGLGDRLVAPATGKAFIWTGTRLEPIPPGVVLGVPTDLGELARSRLLSPRGVGRVAADLVLPRRRHHKDGASGGDHRDPTVADVVGGRIGAEALATLVDPLIGGINAGSAERLSFSSTVPRLAAAFDGRRSLILSLRPLARAARRSSGGAAAAPSLPAFFGVDGGLALLVERLAAGLVERGADLRASTRVRRLTPSFAGSASTDAGWRIETASGVLDAAGVVIATGADEAAALTAPFAATAATMLRKIPSASVATVSLSWPRPVPPVTLGASGFLVPRRHRLLMTACTFTSSKWPAPGEGDRAVFRVSVGRDGDERFTELEDDQLVSAVCGELAPMVGLAARPQEAVVRRHPAAFPQQRSGHAQLIGSIEAALAAWPRLALAGAEMAGVGMPACIESGGRAAQLVAYGERGGGAAGR